MRTEYFGFTTKTKPFIKGNYSEGNFIQNLTNENKRLYSLFLAIRFISFEGFWLGKTKNLCWKLQMQLCIRPIYSWEIFTEWSFYVFKRKGFVFGSKKRKILRYVSTCILTFNLKHTKADTFRSASCFVLPRAVTWNDIGHSQLTILCQQSFPHFSENSALDILMSVIGM